MEDDHVDRLGVEARRRVELTSTNRSIGLIALIIQCPSRNVYPPKSRRTSWIGICAKKDEQTKEIPFASLLCFAGLVAFGEAIRPDPIPNSAVKRFSANGTMSQDLGE